MQEEEHKLKDNGHGEVQEGEVELSQPLLNDWRNATKHPKELIIGDVYKWVTTYCKLHDICNHYAFFSHIELKNILEAESNSYWLLAMQEEINQFEHN